jgi:hypothetical protein
MFWDPGMTLGSTKKEGVHARANERLACVDPDMLLALVVPNLDLAVQGRRQHQLPVGAEAGQRHRGVVVVDLGAQALARLRVPQPGPQETNLGLVTPPGSGSTVPSPRRIGSKTMPNPDIIRRPHSLSSL